MTTLPPVGAGEAWELLPGYADGSPPGLYRHEGDVEAGPGGDLLVTDVGQVGPLPAAELLGARQDLAVLGSRVSRARLVLRVPAPGQAPWLVALSPVPGSDEWRIPDELADRLHPGLDPIRSSWFAERVDVCAPPDPPGAPHRPDVSGPPGAPDSRASPGPPGPAGLSPPAGSVRRPGTDPARWPSPGPSGPTVVLNRWLGRLVSESRPALVTGGRSLGIDSRLVRRGAAPFAADLLDGLLDGARAGGHRFDGSWEYDDDALLAATVRVAAYLVADD